MLNFYMQGNKTLQFYTENVNSFIEGTINVDFHLVCNRFLAHLPACAIILDYGCGAGRDTKYFLEKNYAVDAIDGSPELCKFAKEYTGIDVKCMLFNELEVENNYDGIWACASILHVKKSELPDIFRKMICALKKEGYIYTSFKYGDFEGEVNGRYFSNFTTDSFNEFLRQFPELCIAEEWISSDVRPGRGEEKWLNVILKKRIFR